MVNLPLATTWTILLCCAYLLEITKADVRIQLTAPVNPVEESGILSILCQVWELEDGHEVAIFRRSSDASVNKRLTVGDEVANNVDDERIFVATRTPFDGSTIYFLSIMDVLRSDAGEYSCRISGTTESGRFNELLAVTTIMDVTYFPDENSCSTSSVISSNGYQLLPGKQLVIKCTSQKGNPTVRIEWNNTAIAYNIDPNDISYGETDGEVYSELTLRSPHRNVKPVFICIIKSSQFPGKTKTCHVGPIDMIADPKATPPVNANFPHPGSPTESSVVAFPKPPRNGADLGQSHTCTEQCSAWNESTFYWIISAVVTFIFAIVLFITCIILFVRYNRLPSYQNPKCIMRPQQRDDIYTELDCRLNDNKLYLAIEKRDKDTQQKAIHAEFEEFHYVAPNAPTMQT